MLRVWNYNKSRIHATRGARHVRITLDERLIFEGELRQALGSTADAALYAESILFTCARLPARPQHPPPETAVLQQCALRSARGM